MHPPIGQYVGIILSLVNVCFTDTVAYSTITYLIHAIPFLNLYHCMNKMGDVYLYTICVITIKYIYKFGQVNINQVHRTNNLPH